jgi:hypothetical protein
MQNVVRWGSGTAHKKAEKNGSDTLTERSYHTSIFKERNPQKKTVFLS